MPWRRGTEPHPGWEWAEDLAQYDAGSWSDDGAWWGWIRRKSEAREIAEAVILGDELRRQKNHA